VKHMSQKVLEQPDYGSRVPSRLSLLSPARVATKARSLPTAAIVYRPAFNVLKGRFWSG
jgi:hypothetical protein